MFKLIRVHQKISYLQTSSGFSDPKNENINKNFTKTTLRAVYSAYYIDLYIYIKK